MAWWLNGESFTPKLDALFDAVGGQCAVDSAFSCQRYPFLIKLGQLFNTSYCVPWYQSGASSFSDMTIRILLGMYKYTVQGWYKNDGSGYLINFPITFVIVTPFPFDSQLLVYIDRRQSVYQTHLARVYMICDKKSKTVFHRRPSVCEKGMGVLI